MMFNKITTSHLHVCSVHICRTVTLLAAWNAYTCGTRATANTRRAAYHIQTSHTLTAISAWLTILSSSNLKNYWNYSFGSLKNYTSTLFFYFWVKYFSFLIIQYLYFTTAKHRSSIVFRFGTITVIRRIKTGARTHAQIISLRTNQV